MRNVASKKTTPRFHASLLWVLALPICLWIAHASAEIGMADDWSYIYTARVLADTGHVVYNGLDGGRSPRLATLLGSPLHQVVWILVHNCQSLHRDYLLVTLTIALCQRLFVRFGASEWNATIGSLTLALSPLYLPLASMFMTDIPGFFAIVVCLYGCVNAVEAETDRAALGWLIFASLSNSVLGTVRQTSWLGALVIVPSACWLMRRRRGAVLTGSLLWLFNLAVVFGCLHWFKLQPYSFVVEPRKPEFHWWMIHSLRHIVVINLMEIAWLVLPVLFAFWAKYPFRDRKARMRAMLGMSALLITVLSVWARHKGSDYLAPFTSNIVTFALNSSAIGSVVLIKRVRQCLTLLTFVALLGFALYLWNARRAKSRKPSNETDIPNKTVWTLLGPFTMVYSATLLNMSDLLDRYLVPLIFIALVSLLRTYQNRTGGRLPWITLFLMLAVGAYSTAATHDAYAVARARLAAANEIRAAGIPRTEIQAGFEHDSWPDADRVLAGKMNFELLTTPAGAWHRMPPLDPNDECAYWFRNHVPEVHGHYILSYFPQDCHPASRIHDPVS